MKKSNILKKCTIALTIILIIMNICLYIKQSNSWSDLISSNNSYESAGLLISGIFQFGAFIYGLTSILILWLEYFFIYLIKKVYSKCNGLKKILFLSILSIVAIILLILFTRILLLIFFTLF